MIQNWSEQLKAYEIMLSAMMKVLSSKNWPTMAQNGLK